MNNKLPIATLSELIKLRNILDGISQISWSFSVLNKSHPVGALTEVESIELIEAYNNLIEEAKLLLNK